ncbi:glycosyltransferase family 4 protein [Leptothermofonsia sp. ETS-13]|uniref:glycosyltransferase family 4 protein n=1 Tax=Leptothermofonsia sp. ETS-13 TaxID=3035696 RepID=UPI003BA389A6
MKLTYDYQIFSLQRYGGVSRYIYELAGRIALRNEFEVSVPAFLYINQYLKNSNSRYCLGVSIPPIPKTRKIRLTINHLLSKAYFQYQIPDIVHETYYSFERSAPQKSKIVLTVHDLIHEKFNYLFPKIDKTVWMKEKAIHRADRIICVSENTRRDLLEYYDVAPEKVSVIYLASSLIPESKINRKNLSTPYILYVGERKGYKNFSRLLEAFALSKELSSELNLICFGSLPFSKEELSLLHKLGLNPERVRHVSGDEETLASWYAGAAVFVYPSLYEGFGIPPLEAMACECPVVCSRTSSIPEVVGSAAEFFDPYQPESIADALLKVLNSSDKTKDLIRLGREQVKRFSWEKCVEETCLVYQSLI